MNILVLNQDWFCKHFREAGHTVVTCGFGKNMEIRPDRPLYHWRQICGMVPGGFAPELLIVHDNSAPVILSGLEELPFPSIFYAVDTQHHTELHCALAETFDYTLIAHRDYRSEFIARGLAQPEWMPLWASRYVEFNPLPRAAKAVFVGTLDPKLNPKRVAFFSRLSQLAPIDVTSGAFAEIFPQYQIVVNQSVKLDLNFRVFEALMCGVALLTERIEHGLSELFRENEELVLYQPDNAEECAEKIKWMLGDAAFCRRLAEQGRAAILNGHTEHHRAQRFLEIISTLSIRPKPNRYLGVMVNLSQLAYRAEKIDSNVALHALVECEKVLRQILHENLKLNEEHAYFAVRAALSIDRLTSANHGVNLINQLHDAHPEVVLFGLAKTRYFLNSGQLDAARWCASQISNLPHEEVFGLAEEAISNLLGANSEQN